MQALIDQILHLSHQERLFLLRTIADSLQADEQDSSAESGFEVAKARARAIDQGEDRLVSEADFWSRVEAHRQVRKE
jgi:hypothetical protein